MATFGPYIIQYSSMMNSFYNKGFFTSERFKRFTCCKKFQLYVVLTVLGLWTMPLIDLLIKIEALINLITVFFFTCDSNGKTIGRRLHELMERGFEKAFNLNAFELEAFEK